MIVSLTIITIVSQCCCIAAKANMETCAHTAYGLFILKHHQMAAGLHSPLIHWPLAEIIFVSSD
ncbi:uncharacterized protein LOC110118617 isoform X2 [Ceratitis capitata]|uniref:uncharacterized protein LOC110118617 isoform X2 n=1 Tax=Ceratitis capitata TaxID=7213 RepID=UPI000A11D948|nr:uncharacterized protein LOC110118617 isoform X2 [Ceratitis capitata]